MIIKWLEDAVHDLQALRQYISQDNINVANKVVKEILKKVELLSEHSSIGRQGRVPNTRELIISNAPYIVPYRVKDGIVEILRVFHCSMKWPNEF